MPTQSSYYNLIDVISDSTKPRNLLPTLNISRFLGSSAVASRILNNASSSLPYINTALTDFNDTALNENLPFDIRRNGDLISIDARSKNSEKFVLASSNRYSDSPTVTQNFDSNFYMSSAIGAYPKSRADVQNQFVNKNFYSKELLLPSQLPFQENEFATDKLQRSDVSIKSWFKSAAAMKNDPLTLNRFDKTLPDRDLKTQTPMINSFVFGNAYSNSLNALNYSLHEERQDLNKISQSSIYVANAALTELNSGDILLDKIRVLETNNLKNNMMRSSLSIQNSKQEMKQIQLETNSAYFKNNALLKNAFIKHEEKPRPTETYLNNDLVWINNSASENDSSQLNAYADQYWPASIFDENIANFSLANINKSALLYYAGAPRNQDAFDARNNGHDVDNLTINNLINSTETNAMIARNQDILNYRELLAVNSYAHGFMQNNKTRLFHNNTASPATLKTDYLNMETLENFDSMSHYDANTMMRNMTPTVENHISVSGNNFNSSETSNPESIADSIGRLIASEIQASASGIYD